ncbi:hypothetical protein BLA60_34390 [Actinophytocola xinjiangensis]|uniref:Uncharacterized protein n=1 Tax=Actinophytocola xinjiangensis TaxID=485602 RepID=A0A7Z0WFY9_9PSEU|nr:hypothetical protein BLA60_34390 [Actinophytocola xinjiangensis]
MRGGETFMNEFDALIAEAGRRGYLWHQFRPDRYGPEVLAGVLRWGGVSDVVVLTDEWGTHAYRTPGGDGEDVFAPGRVHWWYGCNAGAANVSMVWILRALLTLPTPDEWLPPLVDAPAGTGVSGARVPVLVSRRECFR